MQLYKIDNYRISLSGKIDKKSIEKIYLLDMKNAITEEEILTTESGLTKVKLSGVDDYFYILTLDAKELLGE